MSQSLQCRLYALLSTLSLVSCQRPKTLENTVKISNPIPHGTNNLKEYGIVALVKTKNKALEPYCTGVLIHKQWVITAAHCIDGPRVDQIVFGLGASAIPTIVSGKSIVHENYNLPYNESFSFDLALIKLDQPAPPFMTPAVLAKDTDFKTGDTVILAGFGVVAQTADLTQVQTNPRQLYTTKTVIKDVFRKTDVDSREDLFAYGLIEYESQDKRSGACAGDSGGPMFITVETKLKLIGIAIGGFSRTCAPRGWYTSMSFYRDWLINKTQVAL